MPRPTPRTRIQREKPLDPNDRSDGRYLQHIGSNDYFLSAYGRGENFDRERMEADRREHRETIIALSKITHLHISPLWSEKEFDNATS